MALVIRLSVQLQQKSEKIVAVSVRNSVKSFF